VIEKRDPAFDRRCHTHVVLLHKQFDEVSLDIGIKKAAQQTTGRVVPILHYIAIGIAAAKFLREIIRQQMHLFFVTERREKVVKIK